MAPQVSQKAPTSKTGGAQLRKPARAQPASRINTSLSAHPRTDPVNALNVLLKLLVSLPSRIGGCQYKLTQAEHALAVHLVGVLDPYVYHGVRALAPSSNAPAANHSGLVHQPTEIIDAILFHVDARKDLLNVGLACKRLHDVVFPRHFDYRVIRCKVSSISVWNHLILHRSLARNVRRVEIIDERASASGIFVPRGILQGDTDLESTDDELTMHAKQERFLATALVRMTGLREFKWSCNHSPISIANVWPTLMARAANLKSINICDNLVFSPRTAEEEEDGEETEVSSDSDGDEGRATSKQDLMERVPATALLDMESVIFRSTPHAYGSSKNPELARIAAMLHQCVNLKHLDVTYIAPRAAGGPAGAAGNHSRSRPLADEFLMYGRWNHLTSLTLSNLRCGSYAVSSSFLSAHQAIEILHIDLSVQVQANGANNNGLLLEPGALPRLREIKASKDVINAILECPSSVGEGESRRTVESVKGFKLSGSTTSARSVSDAKFLANLRLHSGSIKRIEMMGWHDMEDVKKLTASVPSIQHLDIGRRLGSGSVTHRNSSASAAEKEKEKGNGGPQVANIIEWTELLATLPDLVTMHGVKFFYEVASAPVSSLSAPGASWPGTHSTTGGLRDTPMSLTGSTATSSKPVNMSMMERSRMRKNDETAGVLAWKCPKLRRVDHWEESGGRVIVLLREHPDEAPREGKVRWEVRRLR